MAGFLLPVEPIESLDDRALIRANPYQLVEGIVIAAMSVDASEVRRSGV